MPNIISIVFGIRVGVYFFVLGASMSNGDFASECGFFKVRNGIEIDEKKPGELSRFSTF